MEDVLSLIYANHSVHGLNRREVASARLITQRYARQLREYALLSPFYTSNEWWEIGEHVGYFVRGVNEEGETCYAIGVVDGTGQRDPGVIFYVETKQNDDKHTYQVFEEDLGFYENDDMYRYLRALKEGDTADPFASIDIVEPDVLSKLKLTYNRCDKHGIPRSVGLQYVLDGMELMNQTANNLTYAAYAVMQGLIVDIDVQDLQKYVENPTENEYPGQRVKDVLREVMALLHEL